MKSKFHFLSLALIIASSLRCSDGDGPTQPTPVALDLNGAWTLTSTTVPGGPRTQGVEVQIRQVYSSVAFEYGQLLEFKGALYSDGRLSGRLTLHTMDDRRRYDLSGTATSTRIEASGADYSLTLTR